jgi:hypothetical protein
MKTTKNDNESMPPWEEAPEEPQKITAAEASAAAAVIPGRTRWQPSQMGYRWVVRNVSFLLFLTSLAVIYIYNGHYADKISRDLNRTNKELKELQYEYKTLKSEVMFRSKESELARAVEPFGLKELTQPPFVLIDTGAAGSPRNH